MSECCPFSAPAISDLHVFDARGVARRFRHAAIFGAVSSLRPGETMRFYNDHDPSPLLMQLEAQFGSRLGARYVSRREGEVVIDFHING